MRYAHNSESIAYHAARLLLLISRCGRPQSTRSNKTPGVKGRTLLAKLDFFIRYPAYLERALRIRQTEGWTRKTKQITAEKAEASSVESRMVRFRYGPWDHLYYAVLAYLIGKELIVVEQEHGVEVFRLTEQGKIVSEQLAHDPSYVDVLTRAEIVYDLFNRYSGNRLKEFIYDHFPEVVSKQYGEQI